MNKYTGENSTPDESQAAQEASAWLLKTDRGLSAAEQDEFADWISASPLHREQFSRFRRHWGRLDTLSRWLPEHSEHPNPDLLAPPLKDRFRHRLPWALALAASVALVVAGYWSLETSREDDGRGDDALVFHIESNLRTLPDQTVVELNRGAEILVDYSESVRRVVLIRGEAHFTVTKDPSRPFVVNAMGLDVRAVGTAFNVRVDTAAVEVLVTEGKVELAPAERSSEMLSEASVPTVSSSHIEENRPAALIPILEARQRAVVSLKTEALPPQVAILTPGEIERVLSWQHRLLDFEAAPLNEIVAEFNRRNTTQLVILDANLASLRVSAKLRSDNIDGFLHLLRAGFDVQTESREKGEILLRLKR
ncbi:MAG TPA: FecR domain-containing protein [Opitutaceae bacterium]|nr:FecR domain-containing protein [Opitutaceae bacterium]